MEYYFGDFNLPRDKFLQEETKSDDGWVSFDFVATTCPCFTYFDVTGFFVVLVSLINWGAQVTMETMLKFKRLSDLSKVTH